MRAGEQTQKRERRADRRRGLRGDIGERMTPHQRAERSDAHHAPDQHGEPRRRHVDEHDLDGRALLIVVGRREHEPEADRECDRGRDDQPRQRALDQGEKARRIGKVDQRHAVSHANGPQCGGCVSNIALTPVRGASVAAAANGPITRLNSVSAHRIVNGVPNGTGPTIAAFAAETPKISTGIASGNIRIGSSNRRAAARPRAPRRSGR